MVEIISPEYQIKSEGSAFDFWSTGSFCVFHYFIFHGHALALGAGAETQSDE